MKQRHAGLRLIAIVALFTAVWAPALPAARADDGPPPPAVPTPDPAPVDPAESAPEQPALGYTVPRPTGCVSGEYNLSNLVHQPIPDLSTITSTIHVNGAYPYLWDVKLTTYITHTFNSDLDIDLISPVGTDIVLSSKNGGIFDDVFYGTLWEDQAARSFLGGPVTDYTFSNFSAIELGPQEPFGALRGQDPNGDWKLVIRDHRALDVGGLWQWSLKLIGLLHAPDYSSTDLISHTGPNAIPAGGFVDVSFNVPAEQDPLSAITVSTVITHASPGGLNIFLVPPSGYTLTVSSGNGLTNTNAFAGTTWDDKAGQTNAPGPVTLNAMAPNVPESPLSPEEALSAVLGDHAGGIWKLRVEDTVTNSVAGTLGRVTLGVHTAGCNPNLIAGIKTGPGYPRLAQSATITFAADNASITATNLSLTANLDPSLHFQSLSGPWTCATPPVNSAGPTLHCTLPSLAHFSTQALVVTVTTPALMPALGVPVTLTLGVAQETNPADNTRSAKLLLYAHSYNHNPWDFQTDGGGAIGNGGQRAFSNFGKLRLAVRDNSNLLGDSQFTDFGLAPDATGQRWTTTAPQALNGIQVVRSVFAPANQNWLRYVDTFHNISSQPRYVYLSWGGGLGSFSQTYPAATSSGDLVLDNNDIWAVTKSHAPGTPSDSPVVGFAFRSATDTSYLKHAIFNDPNIQASWPVTGNYQLGHLFFFSLPPGASQTLAFFLYRGLAEGVPGPQDCGYYGGCVTPATGAEVTAAHATLADLSAHPPLCDLPPAVRGSLLNWPGLALTCHDAFLPVGFR